jgi:triphosphoribosyl-dephospho-CoA synthase
MVANERPVADALLPARPLTLSQCVTLACLLEATAPKAGNVHRGADFEDLGFLDFVISSVAISETIASAGVLGVGRAILGAIQATRSSVGTNTNLGTVLLLAPLAAVVRETPLRVGISQVLSALNHEDAQCIYEAIRHSQPGGMGRVERMDVRGSAPVDLLAAMADAADRDLVARQYVVGFEQVFSVADHIARWRNDRWPLSDAIIHAHLQLMADFPDSLIWRKCGEEVARTGARMAATVLSHDYPSKAEYQDALADLDFWLRSDGHRRNPGTSADMIAAGLFVALRDGTIRPPYVDR